ncbi:autophagy-related protein 13b isoform X1 [Abrus precatorius]|uniref:Autophagy-related protein 13b isoform X1 n=1 Tax=Abrus precatorius TaxID=3816 RepID=A0A8B8KDN6_ABRPR|nr:autophagy-related protein 13b isoform X1 [Abrus precatorius]XP_027341857.1 autophagy-related protein 13b isoform X1 [Abrus precatorius]XP_027341858.1 autophagy-related protein 13b isoform X1 [Abrus precatorius]
MASSHGNAHLEAAKMEQIITEFFAKSLHIILESRALHVSSRNSYGDQAVSSPCSSSSGSSSVRPRDKRFNLALRECHVALENIDLWRQSNREYMVIDVILVQRPLEWDPVAVNFSPKRVIPRSYSLKSRYPFGWNNDQEELGVVARSEKIVERWVVQYESKKTRDSNSGNRRSSSVALHNLYKKLTLLLRSLYATVRLLPAYKIFRDLNSSGQIRSFTLAHRVSSFVEPFTRKEDAEMMKFGFTPVDTSSGRLCLTVMYCPSASDVSSEPSTPMSPQVITDYVGSPLADPLRRFPSLPVAGFPLHGSPSSLPSSRQRSWSFDYCRASPPSCLPSPTYSESLSSVSYASSRRFPPAILPPHPTEISLIQKKNTGFDEYYPSPSPSTNNSGSLPCKTLLRSESAPVSIPTAEVANSPGYSSRHNLPPSPPLRGSRCTFKIDRTTNTMQTGATVEKFSLGKDEFRRHSGVKISANSSPQISISRSSSRSYQDDFDDTDFTCPFDVDDDDMTDPGSRAESLDHGHIAETLEAGGFFPIRKSHDAAVGALVHMLKKAPPLRQDFSTSEHLSQGTGPETWNNNNQEPNHVLEASRPVSLMSSGIIATRKTTADALEEFQGYREMKNLLLMRGGKPQI